ncbi:MAG: 50S ribosomal protein L24 [bacterium]
MHVKKGDQVVITAGKEKGNKGEIIAIDRKHDRVKVERRNMIVKHKRPNVLTGEEGARIEKENWIAVSNVSLYSEKADGPVRTQMRFVGKGNELFANQADAKASFGKDVPEKIRKVRFSPKTSEVFDSLTGE